MTSDNHNELDEDLQRYVDEWRDALREILGWDDGRIAQWSRELLARVSSGEILHRTPMFDVAKVIMPVELLLRLRHPEDQRLFRRIENILNRAAAGHDFRWEDARQQLSVLLAEHGERLPE